MQDTELFLSLAEIAGVFVGFGALIAVRSGGAGEAHEVAPVRAVVMGGMMTIIAALAPVTLGRYDLTAHQVLALSSVLVAVGYAGLGFMHIRAPEYRAAAAVMAGAPHSRRIEVAEAAAFLVVVGGPAVALIAIVLGVAPELEAALYTTVVVLFLVQAAWTLLWLVFMERHPATA